MNMSNEESTIVQFYKKKKNLEEDPHSALHTL